MRRHAAALAYKTLELLVVSYCIVLRASRDRDVVGAAAVEYLMYCGYVSLAYHWLKMEAAAQEALAAGDGSRDRCRCA